MRIVLLSTAAIALSGCSWLGLGGHNGNSYGQYAGHSAGHGTYQTQQARPCGNCESLARWNVEGGYGADFMAGGNLIKAGQSVGGGTTLNKITNRSAFEVGERADFGVSYALNPNRKVLLNGYASRFDGERQEIGSRGTDILKGDLDDYKTYGLEAGLRQYFLPKAVPVLKSVRPYVEGRLGAARIDDIGLRNVQQTTVNGVSTDLGNIALYDGGWTPTGAGLVGVETPVFDRMTLGLETGIRYNGDLDSAGSFIQGDSGNRWSVPVSLRGRYRF